jgi:hypothetical protein
VCKRQQGEENALAKSACLDRPAPMWMHRARTHNK